MPPDVRSGSRCDSYSGDAMNRILEPWHVESKEFPFVLDEHSKVIVMLPATGQGRTHARLIAAAPDLLNLVETLHTRLTDGRCTIESESREAWVEEIGAVIAKAVWR
jgi:hypothetical protein